MRNSGIHTAQDPRGSRASLVLMILLLLGVAYAAPSGSQPKSGQATIEPKVTMAQVARLEASLDVQPEGVLRSGMPMTLTANIWNTGTAANAPGKLQVIWAGFSGIKGDFQESDGRWFRAHAETEKLDLPSIAPGQQKQIKFQTQIPVPTIDDFVCDWGLGDFQVRAIIGKANLKIGTRALNPIPTFECPKSTIKREPVDVPALSQLGHPFAMTHQLEIMTPKTIKTPLPSIQR